MCTIFQLVFFFQAEDGIRDTSVTGVQTCALPISCRVPSRNVVYSRAKMAPPVRRLASFPLLARPRSRRRWHNQRNQDPQSLARFLCADLQTSRLERCRRASNRRVPVLPFRRFAVSTLGIVSPSALSSLRFPLRNRIHTDTEL